MRTHSFLEKGNYRFWLNDHCFEAAWPHAPLGVGFKNMSHESNGTQRFLWIAMLFVQFFIPLGFSRKEYAFGDEPDYSIDLSREFGLTLQWGFNRWTFAWLFRTMRLEWDYEAQDGTWRTIMHRMKVFSEYHEERKGNYAA